MVGQHTGEAELSDSMYASPYRAPHEHDWQPRRGRLDGMRCTNQYSPPTPSYVAGLLRMGYP
jgi:hypothetical protein